MDSFTIHLKPLPRQHPALFPVATLGYAPRKTETVQRQFQTHNFSFILRGKGTFLAPWGETLQVTAPCVLRQWPGVYMHYGPTNSWAELFLVYQGCEDALQRARYHHPERPLWHIRDTRRFQVVLRELLELAREDPLNPVVDAIDRCCDRLILESLLGHSLYQEEGPTEAVRAIRRHLELTFTETHDFHGLAREYGLSPTHFRRLWNQQVGFPPARYVSELRLQQACRMLVETERPINSIAQELGYEDPLYFSRRFKSFSGKTPSSYRQDQRAGIEVMGTRHKP